MRDATASNGSAEVSLVIAEGARERMRGLIGSVGGPGLLLPHTRSVHTFGMRRSIDVVLLDAHLRVVDVVRLAPRRLLLPRRRARHVLELDRSPFRRGDRLSIADGADRPRLRTGDLDVG
jgi:uncharacterized protein